MPSPRFRITAPTRSFSSDEGGFAALPDEALVFELLDTEGVFAWQVQVSGAPRTLESVLTANPPSKSDPDVPDLELVGDSVGQIVGPPNGPRGPITTVTPDLLFVAAWNVRSIVNGGVSGTPPRFDPSLVEERIVAIDAEGPNDIRIRPIINGERAQYGAADRKSTRLNSSHSAKSRMPSSA